MKSQSGIINGKKAGKPVLLILLVYAAIIIVLTAGGLSYYNYQKEKIIESRYSYLSSISEFHYSQINDWLKEKYAHLEILRSNSQLINMGGGRGNSRVQKGEMIEWFNALRSLYDYTRINLADKNGRVYFSIPEDSTRLSKADSILCIDAREADMIAFSDADENIAFENPVKFYVPIGKQENRTGNVLILEIDAGKVFNKILNRNPGNSPSLEALLIKTYNNRLIYLNKLRFDGAAGEERKALVEAEEIKDRKGFIGGKDYKDDKVIAVRKSVPTTIWTLITKIDRSEFYSPVNDLAGLVVMTIISAALLFAIVLLFIWRKSIIKNYKRMYEAEVEKSKSEIRFDSLVNGVKDLSIIILDEKGNINSWNKGAAIIEGYREDEIKGKNFLLLYPPEEREKDTPAKNLKQALEYGSCNVEGWRQRKDGTLFWANVLINSLVDERGNHYGFLKVTRDLTEKRKTDEEIRMSRDFYLKLLNEFPTPVRKSDTGGKCDYFNRAWLEYTGKTAEEENGEGWIANIHPDDKETALNAYYSALRERKYYKLEYRLRSSEGEFRWMADFGMPYYDLYNNFAGFLGSCFDIDDRRKYEDTISALLRIAEKLYSSLEIDQILDSLIYESIVMTNAEGGFACVVGDDGYEIKRYYHLERWDYFEKTLSFDSEPVKRLNQEREIIHINPAEDPGFIDKSLAEKYNISNGAAVPLFGTSGNLLGFFELHNKKGKGAFSREDINHLNAVAKSAAISITKSFNYEQLRRTEKQLRSSESELRNLAVQLQYAREAERQRIAREVHDELGQLLTGINLNVSLLYEMLEQRGKTSVDDILNELTSIQKYVNMGIQSVRDISSSLRSYILDHLGLIPAVQEYCREIERMSSIKCIFQSEFSSLKFDDERNVALFRIIQEAITNIIRHAEATEIIVTFSAAGNNLEIGISDNGIGMPKDKNRSFKSMGILGMKERALFLDGKLSIESGSGKGTVIKLIVPIKES